MADTLLARFFIFHAGYDRFAGKQGNEMIGFGLLILMKKN